MAIINNSSKKGTILESQTSYAVPLNIKFTLGRIDLDLNNNTTFTAMSNTAL